MSAILDGYIKCALWLLDENPNSGEWAHLGDKLAPETRQRMQEECEAFEAKARALLDGIDSEQAGHDFWLTRNHHGAGFWDRGLGEVGDKLTELSHTFRSLDLYYGDDGLIYQA